jgi:phospholipid/cholesterol/gamma-HCH transport system permease protein
MLPHVLLPLESLGRAAHFALRALAAAALAALRPGEVVRQLYPVLLGSLPLVLTAGLALGVVLWMHLHGTLARFGGPEALAYLPTALALAVVLEFAPIGAGLIVAGRTGASLGAELGAMKQTEQIDALEVLGVAPLRRLVGPRVLACTLALPLLTVFFSFMAVLGGYLAEAVGGGMSWLQYGQASVRGLRLGDVIPATLKTLVFGYLIGTAGCHFGLAAEGGTEGVGRAATRGVVYSILSVMLANVLLVRLIQLLAGL